jgi:hypothetical protein
MTSDGRVYVPADIVALSWKNCYESEMLFPFDRITLQSPRWIRFLQYKYDPERSLSKMEVEVPGHGKGVAGESFG